MSYRYFGQRAFGVELEMGEKFGVFSLEEVQSYIANLIGKTSVVTKIVKEENYGQSDNNDHWHIKTDSTCGVFKSGIEVSSYKASGWSALKDIAETTNALSLCGLQTNINCGLHVHVEVEDYSEQDIGKLLARWIKIEPFLSQLMPEHRVDNEFCKLLSKKVKLNKKYSSQSLWNKLRPTQYAHTHNVQKRTTLNTVNYARAQFLKKLKNHKEVDARARKWPQCNWFNTKRCTVELRMPECTLDGDDVINWVRFMVNLVDYAKSAAMPADLLPVKSPKQFLRMSGLFPNRQITLSDGLIKTSEWLLNRFLKYSFEKQKKEIEKIFLSKKPVKPTVEGFARYCF